MRVNPDDEVYRVNTVWLGPTGLTFPWTARYLAYATWLVVFLGILLVEAVTPLSVNVPPVWELCLATLFTYGLMGFVDHERPLGSVWRTFLVDLTSPRPGARARRVRVQPAVHVREHTPKPPKPLKPPKASKPPRATAPKPGRRSSTGPAETRREGRPRREHRGARRRPADTGAA